VTASPRCPICDGPVTAPDRTASPAAKSWFPFCSERCKQVDLGRWLTGQYVIPGESLHDEESAEEEAAPPPVKDPDEPE
jgi:uncharacterized protein